jgi:hypothetical protein
LMCSLELAPPYAYAYASVCQSRCARRAWAWVLVVDVEARVSDEMPAGDVARWIVVGRKEQAVD